MYLRLRYVARSGFTPYTGFDLSFFTPERMWNNWVRWDFGYAMARRGRTPEYLNTAGRRH